MDLENGPVRRDPADPGTGFPRGLPAQRRWSEETTSFGGAFGGATVAEPAVTPNPADRERRPAMLAAG